MARRPRAAPDIGRLAIRPVGYQAGWLSGRLAIRPVGYQAGWLSGRLAIRPAVRAAMSLVPVTWQSGRTKHFKISFHRLRLSTDAPAGLIVCKDLRVPLYNWQRSGRDERCASRQ